MHGIPGDAMCQGLEQHGAHGEPPVSGQAAGYGASRMGCEMGLEREISPDNEDTFGQAKV